MRSGLYFLLVCVALAPTISGAQRVQLGGAIEWRGQLGSASESSERRSGLAARVMANGFLRRGTDWRVDGAFSQMQYDRRDELGTIPISESGIEVGGFIRQGVGAVRSARPYLLAGAIASLRMSCGVDSAFDLGSVVPCDGSDQFLIGWGVGAGARAEFIGGWDWFLEARLLANVTSAAGGRLLAIGVGAAF